MILLRFLFGRDDPAVASCLEAADADNDDTINVTDAVVLLGFLFRDGRPLPPPGAPGSGPCGSDPGDELGCTVFPGCR